MRETGYETNAIKKVLNIRFPSEEKMEEIIDDFIPEFLELAANNSTEEEWMICFNKYVNKYREWPAAVSFMIVKFIGFSEGYSTLFDELPPEVAADLTNDGMNDILDEFDS